MIRTKFPVSADMLRRRRNTTGPKPVYRGRLHEVFQFALLGATNQDLADLFKVHLKTIEYWVRNYADFRDTKQRGAQQADARVARAMYRRAVGYTYDECVYKTVPVRHPETKELLGREEQLVRRTTRHQPADVKAGFKWLAARQRDRWADVQRMDHRHVGTIEHIHQAIEDIPVQDLTEQEQRLLFKIAHRQLTDGTRNN